MSKPSGPGPAAVASQVGATHTALAQLVARAVSLLALAASTYLVTTRMGNDYADWATVLSTVGLVGVLLEPGLTPVTVRRLATDARTATDPRHFWPLRLGLGAISYVVLVGFVVAVRGLDALPLAAVLGAQVFGRAVVTLVMPWLQVDQRLHRLTAWETLCTLLGLGALWIGVQTHAPIPVLGLLAFTAPLTLLGLLALRELATTPSLSLTAGMAPATARANRASLVREVLPLMLALIITASYTRTSIAFVNLYTDDAEASRFLFGFLFIEQLIGLAGVVSAAVLPLLAARTARAHLLSDDVTHRLLVSVTALGAMGSAAFIGGSLILRRLIGPDLPGAEHYLALLAPFSAVIVPAMTLAYVYVSLGRSGDYLWYAVIGLVANIALSLALVPTWGAAASARITWLTELLVMAVPLWHLARTGAGGRRTAAAILGLVAVSAGAAEIAVRWDGSPLWVGLSLVVAVGLLARSPLVWFAREARVNQVSA